MRVRTTHPAHASTFDKLAYSKLFKESVDLRFFHPSFMAALILLSKPTPGLIVLVWELI